MVGALGRASRGTSAACPWGRWGERVVRGWRTWARLARTSAARPWGRWEERVVRGHYAVGFRRWEERVVRGWRAWARLARHFCRASLQSIQSSGAEGQPPPSVTGRMWQTANSPFYSAQLFATISRSSVIFRCCGQICSHCRHLTHLSGVAACAASLE